MPVTLLTVVVSCHKYKHLWDTILNRDINNLIIICGGASETKLDGQILHLKCNDMYEGLPEKIICAFDFIVNSDRFKDIQYILKVDDHDTEFTSSTIEYISNLQELYNHDYIGQRINSYRTPTYSQWHFNKVLNINNIWYNKKCLVPTLNWADGGTSYILSMKAIKYINSIYNITNIEYISNTYIFEDCMIAMILNEANIFPYKLKYNLRGDKYIY